MIGYCFGGVLSLLHAAAHQGPHAAQPVAIATPVDQTEMGPMSTMTAEGRIDPESLVGDDGNVPASVIENSFKMLKPTGEVAGYVNLWDNMWNDEYLDVLPGHERLGAGPDPVPGGGVRRDGHDPQPREPADDGQRAGRWPRGPPR